MPIQLDFILRRLAEMAEADPTLRDRQPWKAAHERDYAGWARVMAEHYAGDDTNVRTLGAGVVAAYANITVDPFEADADAFLREHRHPTLMRGYLQTAYAPMVELLAYLEANGFAGYIASGGGRDFMRTDQRGGLRHPPERSSAARRARLPRDEHGGTITRRPRRTPRQRDRKPVRIWSRTAPPDARRRQLQRRHPDARLHPAAGTSPHCGCSCCTTTPTASSTTWPGRRGPSSGPAAGVDGGQHQGRLGDGLLRLVGGPRGVARAEPVLLQDRACPSRRCAAPGPGGRRPPRPRAPRPATHHLQRPGVDHQRRGHGAGGVVTGDPAAGLERGRPLLEVAPAARRDRVPLDVRCPTAHRGTSFLARSDDGSWCCLRALVGVLAPGGRRRGRPVREEAVRVGLTTKSG